MAKNKTKLETELLEIVKEMKAEQLHDLYERMQENGMLSKVLHDYEADYAKEANEEELKKVISGMMEYMTVKEQNELLYVMGEQQDDAEVTDEEAYLEAIENMEMKELKELYEAIKNDKVLSKTLADYEEIIAEEKDKKKVKEILSGIYGPMTEVERGQMAVIIAKMGGIKQPDVVFYNAPMTKEDIEKETAKELKENGPEDKKIENKAPQATEAPKAGEFKIVEANTDAEMDRDLAVYYAAKKVEMDEVAKREEELEAREAGEKKNRPIVVESIKKAFAINEKKKAPHAAMYGVLTGLAIGLGVWFAAAMAPVAAIAGGLALILGVSVSHYSMGRKNTNTHNKQLAACKADAEKRGAEFKKERDAINAKKAEIESGANVIRLKYGKDVDAEKNAEISEGKTEEKTQEKAKPANENKEVALEQILEKITVLTETVNQMNAKIDATNKLAVAVAEYQLAPKVSGNKKAVEDMLNTNILLNGSRESVKSAA